MNLLEIIEILSRASESSLKKQNDLKESFKQIQGNVAMLQNNFNSWVETHSQDISNFNITDKDFNRELQVITLKINTLENKIDQVLTPRRFDESEKIVREELRKINNLPRDLKTQLAEFKSQQLETITKERAETLRKILFVAIASAFFCSLLTSGSLILYSRFNLSQPVGHPSSSQK